MYRRMSRLYSVPTQPALECISQGHQWHRKPIRTQRRHRLPPMTKEVRKAKYQKYARNYRNRRQDWLWGMEE